MIFVGLRDIVDGFCLVSFDMDPSVSASYLDIIHTSLYESILDSPISRCFYSALEKKLEQEEGEVNYGYSDIDRIVADSVRQIGRLLVEEASGIKSQSNELIKKNQFSSMMSDLRKVSTQQADAIEYLRFFKLI